MAIEVAAYPGSYTVDTDSYLLCQLSFPITGDSWTEKQLTTEVVVLQCDALTGNAYDELVMANATEYSDGVKKISSGFVKLNVSGQGAPIVQYLHGETSEAMYKVIAVLDNDTIQVEKISSDGAPVGILRGLITNKGSQKIQIVIPAGEKIDVSSSNGSTAYDASVEQNVSLEINFNSIGPVHIIGSGTLTLL